MVRPLGGRTVSLCWWRCSSCWRGARFPKTATSELSAGETSETEAAIGDTGAVAGATDTTLAGGAAATPGASANGPAASGGAAASPGAVDPGPTTGVTDTTIKIGYLLPLTGAAPVPSNFDKGANVYWNYVNGKGGINGRKVQVVIKDTRSSAQVGKDQAKALIETDKVFAVVVLDRLENQQAIGEYLDSAGAQHRSNPGESRPTKPDVGVTIDHAVQGRLSTSPS